MVVDINFFLKPHFITKTTANTHQHIQTKSHAIMFPLEKQAVHLKHTKNYTQKHSNKQ